MNAAVPTLGPLLELNNVTSFLQQQPLFDAVDLTVNAGEIVHISGANGSGKSTLLRLITGLSPCEQGDIHWMRHSIQANTDFKQACCFIGHKNGLNPDLTVAETVDFYHFLCQSMVSDLDGVLLSLQLLEHAETIVKHLSFGQQRRLALVRLLLSNSPLWVLDEPYTGIDSAGRDVLDSLCQRHLQSGGIVILTHHGELNSLFEHQLQRLAL